MGDGEYTAFTCCSLSLCVAAAVFLSAVTTVFLTAVGYGSNESLSPLCVSLSFIKSHNGQGHVDPSESEIVGWQEPR